MAIHDLPDKEFKITIIRIQNEVRRTVHEPRENFNKETDKSAKQILELKNKMTELKNSLQWLSSRQE